MSFPQFLDGYYGTARRIFSTPKKYPFASLGDVATAIYVSTYRIAPGAWVPTARGTVDPDNAGFYLIDESEPNAPKDAAIAEFTRTYASVPTTQTDARKSVMVSKPNIPAAATYDVYQDGALVRAGAGGLYSNTHLFDYRTQTSYDVFGAIQAATQAAHVAPASGTFTFTYKTSTTAALAYNATTGTIQTAINALADMVTDGITATVNSDFSAGNMQITTSGAGLLNWISNPPTINGASLGPATARTADAYLSSGTTVWLFTTRHLITATAHGLTNSGQKLAMRSSRLTVFASSRWSVYDANTLLVDTNRSSITGTVDAIAPFLVSYIPGSKPVPCDLVTRFSLSAIVPDTYQGEGDAFLQAVFAGSTAINYRVGDAQPWPTEESSIRSLTTTKISAANL